MCQPLILFNNKKNALNPGFCKGEATFSHLSCWGHFGRFFQLGHLDLLHTAPFRLKHLFKYVRIIWIFHLLEVLLWCADPSAGHVGLKVVEESIRSHIFAPVCGWTWGCRVIRGQYSGVTDCLVDVEGLDVGWVVAGLVVPQSIALLTPLGLHLRVALWNGKIGILIINIRNTEEAVGRPQYFPELLYWSRLIRLWSVWWPRPYSNYPTIFMCLQL